MDAGAAGAEGTGADAVVGRVTNRAVREATGRAWGGWFEVLDAVGASEWDHQGIVGYLAREHPAVGAWWQQSITVAYEQARGKRAVGETADAGYEVGVRRTVSAARDEVWEILVARPDLWLGVGADVDVERTGPYSVAAGRADLLAATGDVRVVRPGHRVRMTWRPEGWAAPATVQLTLSASLSGKTTIGVHLEKLPDAPAREAMRSYWRAVLAHLVEEIG